MKPRRYPRSRFAVAILLLGTILLGPASASAQPRVQALPPVGPFISNVDLECFRTNPYQPPSTAIVARHINPLLTNLPTETHILGNREQLCVPVAKNNILPPPGVIDFIRWVDLACYRITGVNVNRTLVLGHLNPVLSGIPPKTVTITVPVQLCVPVIKNNALPPAEVLSLVQFIDLKCYLEVPNVPLGATLGLRHLNPVLSTLPPSTVVVGPNRHLCVPILKGTTLPPPEIMNIISFIDVEKYDLPTITPAPPAIVLTLAHINPLLAHLPREQAQLLLPAQLMLPVRKANVPVPPGT